MNRQTQPVAYDMPASYEPWSAADDGALEEMVAVELSRIVNEDGDADSGSPTLDRSFMPDLTAAVLAASQEGGAQFMATPPGGFVDLAAEARGEREDPTPDQDADTKSLVDQFNAQFGSK